jgi:DNA polymerase-3 subunit epsilon
MGDTALMSRRWRRSHRIDGLDRPWREIDYVVVDLETTGLDRSRDAIASYGATVIHNGRMVAAHNIYGLVRPECAVSAKSITIHALRPADLAEAPSLSAAVEVLHGIDRRSGPDCAAWIEQAFLSPAFR